MSQVIVPGGRQLACLVCGEGDFGYREVKLNTSGMSFMNLYWANRSGTGCICSACGFVHTFFGPVEWRDAPDVDPPSL
jgi:hypothetical protein